MIKIPNVADMDDETLLKHMELRHEDDLRLKFHPEQRRLSTGTPWRTYHDAMHRLYPRKYEHHHEGTVRG